MFDDYDDIEFVCGNEENGTECDYPFCDCEIIAIEEYLELPDIFDMLEDGGIDEDGEEDKYLYP